MPWHSAPGYRLQKGLGNQEASYVPYVSPTGASLAHSLVLGRRLTLYINGGRSTWQISPLLHHLPHIRPGFAVRLSLLPWERPEVESQEILLNGLGFWIATKLKAHAQKCEARERAERAEPP